MCPTVNINYNNTAVSNWCPTFEPGPEWRSFEKFRVAGSTALEGISAGRVATLHVKVKTFRILRDDDFQKLVGLASEVHRLKRGLTFVITAAKVVAKHPNDPDSLQLLWHSVLCLSESSVLPQRGGHDAFQITAEEADQYGKEDLDLSKLPIPRPKL